MKNYPTVYVIDFGAQYSKLIARRIREANVYSEIVPCNISLQEIKELNPAGLILSGGPKSVHIKGSPQIDSGIYELGLPVLGICYGAQLMALQLGGDVSKNDKGEYGRTEINIENPGEILPADMGKKAEVWMSHFDAITSLPAGFTATASSKLAPIEGFENEQKKLFGLQFHPEVAHTRYGSDIFGRFLHGVCRLVRSWNPEFLLVALIPEIKEQVSERLVICGLSGGVDSAVAATIVHKAIGSQLICIFVDNGLMRKGEAEQIRQTFSKPDMPRLISVDASDFFLKKLAGILDPEEKRKIVGDCFIQTFEKTAKKIEAEAGKGSVHFLVQGTIYPDVIESGGGDPNSSAAVIKSHHNVGGLPENMNLELIEPLRHLFKDEVRALGKSLGLPDEITWRQPFPGPGLAVRIIGEVTPEKTATLAKADSIIREETAFLGQEIWQAFGVLLDIRSVGVMGDERTYANPLVIRAVSSDDAMTADWVRLPYDLLEKMSSRIVSEIEGINRVVYDITSKPPGTIEWE